MKGMNRVVYDVTSKPPGTRVGVKAYRITRGPIIATYAFSGMRAITLISKSKPDSQVTPTAVQLG